MNSKRLAAFAASMQWADEVKVVSRGTPMFFYVGDLGNSVVGVCRGERRRKWREVPDSEACTFAGVPFLCPGPAGRKRG